VTIVCERLQALGSAGGEVRSLGGQRIRVVLPGLRGASATRRVSAALGADAQLRFYDWETNLIGPERAIGGHPGKGSKPGALKRAKREWRRAGRPVGRAANKRLILAGAFPNAYSAVRLASRQKARRSCAICSTLGARFYVFDRSSAHKLIAGPIDGRPTSRNGIVLEVPAGTTVISERQANGAGVVLTAGAPGWFALRDRPALSGAEIVDPAAGVNDLGSPDVTFGFTTEGRIAFQRVTRAIARRGEAEAAGPVSAEEAEMLSGHFALVFDGEVKTRPIINFAYNPDGIDGRTGAEIAGGLTSPREAHDLAAILRTGPLPIELKLVGSRTLVAQNS
jgi:SecD/SecF fusion protein